MTKMEAGRERVERLHTLLPKGKLVSGHCHLAAEAELGLVRYFGTGETEPNTSAAIADLKSRCHGAWWKYPNKTEGRDAELIIRCHAPWHDGTEVPVPREELKKAEPKKKKRKAGRATDTHCANGHEWNDENLTHDSRGSRVCRACKREAAQRLKERRQAQRGK